MSPQVELHPLRDEFTDAMTFTVGTEVKLTLSLSHCQNEGVTVSKEGRKSGSLSVRHASFY